MSKINVNTWEPESLQALTMGASGDTVTVPSGVTLVGFSSMAWQAVQTTGFTAAAGKGYPVNTTAGGITVTLPAGSVGDEISIVAVLRKNPSLPGGLLRYSVPFVSPAIMPPMLRSRLQH